MNPEIFFHRPEVGLLSDPASTGAAGEALTLVEAELGKFGLTADSPGALSLLETLAYARGAAERGLRTLVVATADGTLTGRIAAETSLHVL